MSACQQGVRLNGSDDARRKLTRMSRPVWNLGDGLEQLSYAATSFSGQ